MPLSNVNLTCIVALLCNFCYMLKNIDAYSVIVLDA